MTTTQTPPATQDPQFTVSSDTALTADTAASLRASQRASQSKPAFGSVTQSSNTNAAGVTTDRATVTHNGTDATIVIRRADSSTITFSTATSLSEAISDGESSIEGHEYQGRYLLEADRNSISAMYGEISWNSADPTDYLAGGYWIHVTGDLTLENVATAEVGAFIDGPELDGTPSMPSLGTATYSGSAAGMYASRHGSDTDEPRGTLEAGEWEGPSTLNVNFARETISGCIGCDDEVYAWTTIQTPDGETDEFEGAFPGGRMTLGETSIRNGAFTGNNLSWSQFGITVSETTGQWGGKFSNIANADGNPRLVAGTLGANVRTTGGSTASVIGAFAATQD